MADTLAKLRLPYDQEEDPNAPPIPLRRDAQQPEEIPQMAQPATVPGMVADHPLKSFGLPKILSPRETEISEQRSLDESKLAKLNGPHLGQEGSALPGLGGKILHGLATAGNIAGNLFFPGQMAMIPGTQLHNDIEKRHLTKELSGLGEEEQTAQKNEAQQTYQQQEGDRAEAAAAKDRYEVEHPKETQDKFALQQTDQGLMRVNETTGEATPVQAGGKPLQKPDAPDQFVYQQTDHGLMRINKQTGEAAPVQYNGQALKPFEKPEKSSANEGSWQLQEDEGGNPILFNPKTGQTKAPPAGLHQRGAFSKANKATPDEQRRSDLAGNLEENLSTLEEIVNRRPDLFGPVAGRLTGFKAGMGTNDPDIGTLETIKHQLGMAQISAHGMRSAQGIDAAAQSIVNGFKNGPDAVRAAINAARNSVQTFKNDANRGAQQGGQSQPVQPSPPRPANVPEGYVFNQNGPKGAGWYKPQAQ